MPSRKIIFHNVHTLTLHIEYLLLRHDCVVLPGFGAFINVRNAARYDHNALLFQPMNREVRFNKALVFDDGLLANSYARKNRIGFQEGREMLRRDVERLRHALEIDGEATLGSLGILSKDGENISFRPMKSPDQLSRMLGYIGASSESPQLKKSGHAASDAGRTHSEPENPTGETHRKFNTKRNYYIPVNKIFARTAACLIVMFLAVFAIVRPLQGDYIPDRASVVPIKDLTPAKVAKTDAPEEVLETQQIEEVSQETIERQKEEKYHAIVATFNTETEAEKFIASHPASGYDLHIISTRTKSRVSALDSSDKEELQKVISAPKFREEYSEAWIWTE